MDFNISGKISFNIDFDIEAETEEEALNKAKEILKDYYHLKVENAYHDNVNIDIDCIEIEYED